jgi:hypothetical protein
MRDSSAGSEKRLWAFPSCLKFKMDSAGEEGAVEEYILMKTSA